MWARVHKLDRVKSNPGGGAIILIEDERTGIQMQRVPGLSLLIAVARVLSAQRALDAKFDGKGEIRYVSSAVMPSELSEAITRAGASIAERNGELVTRRAQPASVAALIDVAFSALAHHVRSSYGSADFGTVLKQVEKQRRAKPLDRDEKPELYWPAVLELAALAGEQSRSRGGRWIDTQDLPLPFALKFSEGALAHPTIVAQRIVEGGDDETLTGSDALAATASKPAPPIAKAEPPADEPGDTTAEPDNPGLADDVSSEPSADAGIPDEPAAAASEGADPAADADAPAEDTDKPDPDKPADGAT